jgi:hypothetical protein
METPAALAASVDALGDGWCERRSLKALRSVLAGPRPCASLTSGGELRVALRNVLATARSELSDDEIDVVAAGLLWVGLGLAEAAGYFQLR